MRTKPRPSSGLLSGLLAVCCGVLLVLAPGAAAASPSASPAWGPHAPAPVSVEMRSSPRAVEYAAPPAEHGARTAPAEPGPAQEPSEESSSGQDRRYVIGAIGAGLVLLVLLVRRKRGKDSIVLRWRKRS